MPKCLKEALSWKIPTQDLAYVCDSYDIVGDIAIIRLNRASEKHGQTIANGMLQIHRNVKTVLAQVTPVNGSFRTRQLQHILGEKKTTTVHKESRCLFAVDLANCYFSPRLSYERMGVARQTKEKEVVVNMFAGVGCFSIVIARYSPAQKIYSIDINPAAVEFMRENIRINKVYGRVNPLFGDTAEYIKCKLPHAADRVLCLYLRKPMIICLTRSGHYATPVDEFTIMNLNTHEGMKTPYRKSHEK